MQLDRKKSVFLVLGLAILVGSLWFGSPYRSDEVMTPPPAGELIAEERFYDFGAISSGSGPVTHDFPVRTANAEPTVVARFYTSCACLSALLRVGSGELGPVSAPRGGAAPYLRALIPPGERIAVRAILDPGAFGRDFAGEISRVVTLETATGDRLQFKVSATLVP